MRLEEEADALMLQSTYVAGLWLVNQYFTHFYCGKMSMYSFPCDSVVPVDGMGSSVRVFISRSSITIQHQHHIHSIQVVSIRYMIQQESCL